MCYQKVVGSAAKRVAAGHLIQTHSVSQRRVCRLLQLHRSMARYQRSHRSDDPTLEKRLKALAEQYPRYGYSLLHGILKNEGLVVNRKRTYRIYTHLGLQVRTKRRKKLNRPRIPMGVPDSVNQRWSVDFVSDQLANGRRFRVCNIIDDFSRECVAQVTDFSISGERLVRELDQLARIRSLPGTIVLDNGPELTSKAMFFWSRRTGVKLHFIQPGKPTQNAFIVSFNSKFHDTCLSQHWFPNLAYAPTLTEDWRREYNEERPKKILGV
jgi:putative transposase